MRRTIGQLIAVVVAMTLVLSSCGVGSSSTTVEVGGPSLQPRAEASLPRTSATPDDPVDPVDSPASDGGFVLNLPGSEPAASSSFLTSATAQLQAADSYRFEIAVGMDIGDLSSRLHIPAGTVLATGGYVDGRSITEMDMSPMFGGADNLGDVDDIFGTDLSMDMIADEASGVMYMRAPWMGEMVALMAEEAGGSAQLDQLLALRDGWVRLDASALVGDELASLTGSQTGSADTIVELLSGAGGTVEELGVEEIRGVSTRHIRATTSLLDMVDAQGQSGMLETLSAQEQAFVDHAIPFDVWIDAEGRLVRLDMAMDLVDAVRGTGEKVPAGTRAEYSMRFDVFDYNDPSITVSVPTGNIPDVTMAFLAIAG